MSIADRVSALVNIAGETVTIRELTSTIRSTSTMKNSHVYTDHVVIASIREFLDSQVTGLVQRGDRVVRVSATDLGSYIPGQNDKVVISGTQFNIKSVNQLTAKNETALYEIRISS